MSLEVFSEINGFKRALSNKSYLKKIRNEGFIPAVFYSISAKKKEHSDSKVGTKISNKNNQAIKKITDLDENIFIQVSIQKIEKLLEDPCILTRIFKLDIDNKHFFVIIKDIAYDPISDKPIHVDFMEVNEKSITTCIVPVRAVNEDKCEEIKRGGDVFILNYNVKVNGLIKKMPNSIDVDIQKAKIGDVFYGENKVYLPEGFKFIQKHVPLAKVSGKKVMKDASEEASASTANAAESKGDGK